MASLHVRNVDDDLVRRLKERASLHGRSAEAEHREILKDVLDQEAQAASRKAEAWRRMDAFRKSLEGRPHTPSELLLRESRDER